MSSNTRQQVIRSRDEAARKQSKVREDKLRRKSKLKASRQESEKKRALRLKKKRLAEKNRREKLKQDPKAYEERKQAERIRWHQRVRDGKIQSIDQLSEREKKHRRRKGNEAFKKWYKKKKEQQNMPPVPCVTPERTNSTKQQLSGSTKRRRANQKLYSEIAASKTENASLKRSVEKYKKRSQRRSAEDLKRSPDSPRKVVKKLLSGTPVRKSARERLLAGEVIRKQMKFLYKSSSSTREKKALSCILGGKIVKRYRKVEKVRQLVASFKSSRIKDHKSFLDYERHRAGIPEETQQLVQQFYLENSRECPGKKDCLTESKSKKQKRYLNSTMEELHKKFTLKYPADVISYTAFTRLRPFHAVPPKVTSRDTCLCPTHENMSLLVKLLHRKGIINENSSDKVIQSITCTQRTEQCLSRECATCKSKRVKFEEFADDGPIQYQQWVTKREERVSGKTEKLIKVTFTAKEVFTATPTELKKIFENSLGTFMQHVHRVEHQYQATTECKKNLTAKDLKVLMDFNQNYLCKYGAEPQSVHFGASRQQVTLHTGMVYTEKFSEGFTTLSPSLKHDPCAIAAHLTKVLDHYLEKFPSVEHLHFLSDGPTTQYRNRKMFHLVTTYIVQRYPQIRSITYNFSEAGHGKNAADGIGAVVKRTADRIVAQGTDVNSFEILLRVIEENCQNLFISSVSEFDIQAIQSILPATIPPFDGTMKVHQYKWHKSNPDTVNFNSLSCYKCKAEEVCCHFHIGQWSCSTLKKQILKKKAVGAKQKTVKRTKKTVRSSKGAVKSDKPTTKAVKAKEKAAKAKAVAGKRQKEAVPCQTRKSSRSKGNNLYHNNLINFCNFVC